MSVGGELQKAVQACNDVLGRWGLSDYERGALLDMAGDDEHQAFPHDFRDRVTAILALHAAMLILFGSVERGRRWLRRSSSVFGVAPLEVMLRDLDGITRVQRYLEAQITLCVRNQRDSLRAA